MIDHAVLRELAAMLYDDTRSATGERAGPALFLSGDGEEPDGKPVRWYDALMPRRTTII